jgi:hypothetical protein
MSFLAFQIVRASTLNRIQPVEYSAIQSNVGTQTITTSEVDLVGATVTFTSLTAAVCTLWAIYDVEVTATGAMTFQGRISVDGATITTKEGHITGSTAIRVSVAQTLDFTLSGAGTHTVKMRGLKTAAAATVVTYDNHTSFSLQVREVV